MTFFICGIILIRVRVMKKNGYTMIELLVVILVLGLITVITLSTTSYAFKDNSNELYEQKVYTILHQAKVYGGTLEKLKEEENLMITLNDLVKEGYYIADGEDGNVIDPRNSKAKLNGLKIKISYNGGDIEASVVDD